MGNRKILKFLRVVLVVLIGAVFTGTPANAKNKVSWRHCSYNNEKKTELQILAINDFHGQISAGQKVAGRPVGSAPVLASYLREASAENPGNTFIVQAGDLVGASPPSSALLQDEPTIMFFNMLGNHFCSTRFKKSPLCNLIGVPGNHEFDEGYDEMMRLINGGNHENGPFLQAPYRGAAFPYLCANVVDKNNGRTILPPFVIKWVDGIPVAFIGAVLEETPTIVTASGVANLSFLDEAESINKYVRFLRIFGIRTFIAVIHQGGYQDSYDGETDPEADDLAGTITGILDNLDDEIDVVVTGHAHGFTNELYRKSNGKTYLVTQAWSKSTAYAGIDIEISRRSRDVVGMSSEIVTTWADEGPGLTPVPEIEQLVSDAEEMVGPIIDEYIAEAAIDITRDQSSAGESALGNLVADAQRIIMETDFAFMNPGGIRADIEAGVVTWGELYTVQPFNNYLVTMEMTGQQIYDLLNQQWAGQPYTRFLQISGLKYTWDASLPENDRIVEVTKADGTLLDLEAIYTVTANNFLADGGDNFTVFRDALNKVTGPIDLDALIYYLQGITQPFSAEIEGRINMLN